MAEAQRPDVQVVAVRTVADLREAVGARHRRRAARQREEAEQARRERLRLLAEAEPALWDEVVVLIEQKKATAYAEAVKVLLALRMLADHRGERLPFAARVQALARSYATRPALQRRLREAGLLTLNS